MPDFTKLTTQLYTGGAIRDQADVQAAVALGITAVIDVRLADDRNLLGEHPSNAADLLAAHPSIAYLYNGAPDNGAPKPVSWFERSWDFALPILSNGGVVAAHCLDGHNRGPSQAAFLLMAYYGMTEVEAFALITDLRPIATLRYLPDAVGAIIAMDLQPSVLVGGPPGSNVLGAVAKPDKTQENT